MSLTRPNPMTRDSDMPDLVEDNTLDSSVSSEEDFMTNNGEEVEVDHTSHTIKWKQNKT